MSSGCEHLRTRFDDAGYCIEITHAVLDPYKAAAIAGRDLPPCPWCEAGRLTVARDNLMAALHRKQSKIDALMLEFCPGEMSAEQRAKWAAAQRVSSPHRLDRAGDCRNPGCTYPSVGNWDAGKCTATVPIPDPETLCRNVTCDHTRASHLWLEGKSFACTVTDCGCAAYTPPPTATAAPALTAEAVRQIVAEEIERALQKRLLPIYERRGD